MISPGSQPGPSRDQSQREPVATISRTHRYHFHVCNAYNHPPGCQCGWGGEGHLGGGGGGWDARATWGGSTRLDSPNAHCPICGASVFFIHPMNGGSVWFDELGPPWPKHPCMDSAQLRFQFPEPSSYPRERVFSFRSSNWYNQYVELLSYRNPSWDCWTARVGGMHLLIAAQPPTAFSPIFVHKGQTSENSIEIEYVSSQDGGTEVLTLRAYDFDRFFYGSCFSAPETVEEAWVLLQHWIEDRYTKDPSESSKFVHELRESIDWIIEQYWQYQDSGKGLVKTRIEKVCSNFPGIDPETIFSWMSLLLR